MLVRKGKMNKRIVFDHDVFGGKPIIKGTRISVELILKLLSSGMTTEEILGDYSHLKKEDVLAAVDYAAQAIRHEKIVSHYDLAQNTK